MPQLVSRYVEVYPFRFHYDSIEFLLLLRAPNEHLYPGIWQVVTGKCEEGESARAAAQRELTEETRLQPVRFWVVPRVNVFYDPASDEINLSPLFACQCDTDASPVLSSEHSAWRWMRKKEALGLLVWPGQREGLTIVEEYIASGEKASDLLRLS